MNKEFIKVVFLVSLVTIFSWLLTILIRKLAIRHQVIDFPNDRSSHHIPTPRGGGLAIAIVWFSFLLIWKVVGQLELTLFLALLPGLLVVLIGLIDDIKNLSAKVRFLVQLLASILGLYFLGGLQVIDWGFAYYSLHWIVNIVVVLAMLWMINLFNFLDGSDGFLGSEGVFVFISLFLFTRNILVIIFAASIFGFLILNWPRAKIFCGDVGSTLIGYTFMIFAIYFQNVNQLSILIPIILSGLFTFDATITLFRRFRRKEKLSEAHCKHAYQRFIQSGFTHKTVLGIGFLVNLLLLILCFIGKVFPSLLLISFVMHIFIVYFYVRYADTRKAFE